MILAKNYLSKYGILIALLVICIILSVATPLLFYSSEPGDRFTAGIC